MVADALSQKLSGSLHYICTVRISLLIELRKLDIEFKVNTSSGVLTTLRVRPILIKRILVAQRMDEKIKRLYSDVKNGQGFFFGTEECGLHGVLSWATLLPACLLAFSPPRRRACRHHHINHLRGVSERSVPYSSFRPMTMSVSQQCLVSGVIGLRSWSVPAGFGVRWRTPFSDARA